jgi:hypothetical protein
MAQRNVQLVHEREAFSVLRQRLIVTCEIFHGDPTLVRNPLTAPQISSFLFRLRSSLAKIRLP